MKLSQFIGEQQMAAIRAACRGEEGEYFRAMLFALKNKIAAMPKTYETDGQGDEAVAVLHYFYLGSDWYITERDMEEEQYQAFGCTCLNGDRYCAELGYINLVELLKCGVELDLYYTPETIGAIRERFRP